MKIKQLAKKILSNRGESSSKPMAVITTVPRPEQPINRISEDKRKEMIDSFHREKEESSKLGPYFIQEIFDRLYGPESEEYVKELHRLNSKFKARQGRTGPQIYRDEI